MVDAAGEGAEEWVGRRVVGITPQSLGGLAERRWPARGRRRRRSSTTSRPRRSRCPSTSRYLALHERAGLQAGETVVVRGGASAVGTAAIQLAVAAGARVIAIAGGPEKAALCTRPRRRPRGRPHDRGRLRRGHGRDRRPRRRRHLRPDRRRPDRDDVDLRRARRPLPRGRLQRRPRVRAHRPAAAQAVDGEHVRPRRAARLPRHARATSAGSASTRFPPEVGQRVHEHLLELVAAGRIRPVVGPDDRARRGRGRPRGPRRPAYVGPHRRGARAGERRRDRGRRGRADRARRLRRDRPSHFREGLELLRRRLDREAQLNDLGNVALPACRDRRAGRTGSRSSTGRSSTPRSPTERIEAPVVVIGMFRAGTTFLSHLLDQDPANRALLGWESQDSAPAADDRTQRRPAPAWTRPRAASTCSRCSTRRSARSTTRRPSTRPSASRSWARRSRASRWEAIANVPSYGAWWRAADNRPALRLPPAGAADPAERRRPRPLDAQEPAPRAGARRAGRHLPRRPAGAAAPRPGRADRLGVQPDPVMSSTFSDADHRAYIAEHWQDTLEESVRRIDDFRARRPEHPILDVAVRRPGPRPARHPDGALRRLGLDAGRRCVRRDRRATSSSTRAGSSARTATTSASSASPRPAFVSGSAATARGTASSRRSWRN